MTVPRVETGAGAIRRSIQAAGMHSGKISVMHNALLSLAARRCEIVFKR